MLAISFGGCDHFFVGFVSNPGGGPLLITGTVVATQLGVFSRGNGSAGTLTAVTFDNGGSMNTTNFCGDQRQLFPINQVVRVSFNVGIYCSTVIVVTVQS
jgi:hypothetical protein